MNRFLTPFLKKNATLPTSNEDEICTIYHMCSQILSVGLNPNKAKTLKHFQKPKIRTFSARYWPNPSPNVKKWTLDPKPKIKASQNSDPTILGPTKHYSCVVCTWYHTEYLDSLANIWKYTLTGVFDLFCG